MDWCWNWSSNTLTTWYKEMIHCKGFWCWERSRAVGEEGNRGWNGWIVLSNQWTWAWANWEIVKDWEAWHAAVHGVAKSWTWLRDWTTTRRWLSFFPLKNVHDKAESSEVVFWGTLSSSSPQFAGILTKGNFPFYQQLLLGYWSSSSKQPVLKWYE